MLVVMTMKLLIGSAVLCSAVLGGFYFAYATVMAAGAIVTVPLVIMVLIFQRKIIAGLTSGGVKA